MIFLRRYRQFPNLLTSWNWPNLACRSHFSACELTWNWVRSQGCDITHCQFSKTLSLLAIVGPFHSQISELIGIEFTPVSHQNKLSWSLNLTAETSLLGFLVNLSVVGDRLQVGCHIISPGQPSTTLKHSSKPSTDEAFLYVMSFDKTLLLCTYSYNSVTVR